MLSEDYSHVISKLESKLTNSGGALILSVIIEGLVSNSRSTMWWLNLLFITIIYFTAIFYATKPQIYLFYLPMIILVILLIIAGIFVFF